MSRLLIAFLVILFFSSFSGSKKEMREELWYYPSDFVPGVPKGSSGKVLAKGTIDPVNGKRKGVWTYFYPDGKILAKGAYRNDCKYGLWNYYTSMSGLRQLRWGKDVEMKDEIRFVDGKPEMMDYVHGRKYSNGVQVFPRKGIVFL